MAINEEEQAPEEAIAVLKNEKTGKKVTISKDKVVVDGGETYTREEEQDKCSNE